MNVQETIEIQAQPEFVTEYITSNREKEFIFAYRILITNHSPDDIQLLSRHWLITDADGKQTVVEGEGVIGEQPVIKAGASYHYSSGAHLQTPVGVMQGNYTFIDSNSQTFKVTIPAFRLAVPGMIH